MRTTIEWLTTAFDRVVGFVPNLIAGLVILLLGWIIALALSRATRALAHRLGFDKLVARLGVGRAATTSASSGSSRWLGSAVYVIVMLVAIMQASRAWRLDFVANGLGAIVAYLPHAIAAAIVFGASLLIGNWVRDRVFRPAAAETTGAPAGAAMESPRILPSLVRGAIIAVGAFMALRELQIAPEIVNMAFMLTLGAIAVAGALAFGLGARDVAGRMAHSWWERRSLFGSTTPTPGAPPPRVGVSA